MKSKTLALLGLLLLAAAAVQAQLGSNYEYSLNASNASTITITGYSGPSGAVVIPTNINNLLVTGIGDTNSLDVVFTGNKVTSVTIPSSVTSIGEETFFDCTSLTNVTIPASVTSIGPGAFQDCTNLTHVNIPGSVTSFGPGAFENCTNLTSVSIPNGVAIIWPYTFAGCASLTSITIPSGVTNIQEEAFEGCSNLTSIYFEGNSPSLTVDMPVGGSKVFYNDKNAIVYYLPGTTGWQTNFAGVPAVLWNPLIQTGDGSFGVQNNQFGFNITGTNNYTVVVEACTDLLNPVWVPLQTNTLVNGSYYFSDPQWTNSPNRFYGLGLP